jgi:hypothetical protein
MKLGANKFWLIFLAMAGRRSRESIDEVAFKGIRRWTGRRPAAAFDSRLR